MKASSEKLEQVLKHWAQSSWDGCWSSGGKDTWSEFDW